MVGSRTAAALVVGAASLAASVLVYYYTGSLLFFLFVPFVPFLFSDRKTETEQDTRAVLECSRCGFSTRDPEFEYCPYDGSRLYER
jgi:hypothetical protein